MNFEEHTNVDDEYKHMLKVAFNYETFKNNPNIVVTTSNGYKVTQLTKFDTGTSQNTDNKSCLVGVILGAVNVWSMEGFSYYNKENQHYEISSWNLVMYMPKPCPRYNMDILIAYAQGYDIEYKLEKEYEWILYEGTFSLENPHIHFRVKPGQGYEGTKL